MCATPTPFPLWHAHSLWQAKLGISAKGFSNETQDYLESKLATLRIAVLSPVWVSKSVINNARNVDFSRSVVWSTLSTPIWTKEAAGAAAVHLPNGNVARARITESCLPCPPHTRVR